MSAANNLYLLTGEEEQVSEKRPSSAPGRIQRDLEHSNSENEEEERFVPIARTNLAGSILMVDEKRQIKAQAKELHKRQFIRGGFDQANIRLDPDYIEFYN